MKTFFIFLLLIVFSTKEILAHQPKLIFDNPNFVNPYKVMNPEISKAFYGKLNGKPHYYKITSNQEFMFYTGILIPKISEKVNTFSIDVLDSNNQLIYIADGSKFKWTPWYEPYARDWYFKGPEIGKNVGKEFKTSINFNAGTYYIKVYNQSNTGSYSLAIGELEFFGSNIFEQIITWVPILFYIAPAMDIIHWNKFDILSYIPHILLLVIVFLINLLTNRFRRK